MRAAAAWIALALVLGLCASFCLTRLSEVDFHWHLLAGERILQEHRVPRTDAFTFPSAGRPWTDLHWLFQVVVAWVWARAGWAGLDLLKIALIVCGFAGSIMAALRRGASPHVTAAVGLLAVVASQERFTLRPEAASFFCLGLLLLGLEWRRDHPRAIVLAPPLLAIWANFHALYAVGLAVLILALAGEWFEARIARRSPVGAGGFRDPQRLFAAAVAASFPATLLTPYGLSGWALPARLLFERIGGDNLYSRSIAEFQAPFGGAAWTSSVQAFALLAVLVALGAWPGRRALRASDLLLLTAFVALALMARRNIPLFALVAVPAGSPAIDAVLRRLGGPRSAVPVSILVILSSLGLMGAVATDRIYQRDGTQRYFGRGEAPGFYPEGAAAFVLERSPPGEAFHDMAVGGYLEWRWHPRRRTFIDGRLEVHSPVLFATYLRMQGDPQVFEGVARDDRIGIVVLSLRQSPEAAPLLRHLAAGQGWRPVFLDLAAAVFVREDPVAGGAGAPASIDLGDPRLATALLEEIGEARARSAALDPLPAGLRRLLPRREAPVAEANAAIFFAVLGRDVAAEALFREALRQAPRNAALRYDLGLVLVHAGRPQEARIAYERALGFDPGFTPARSALALLLLAHDDPEGALAQWAMVERSGSLDATALEARGGLLARLGRIDEAIEDLRRAVGEEPRKTSPRLGLALLYERRGLEDQAIAEIRRAADLDPESPAPRLALARVRAARGDVPAAEREYRSILARQPGNAEAHLGLALLLVSQDRLEEALGEIKAAVGAGLDRAVLRQEPALRRLAGRRDFEEILRGASP